MTNPQRPTVKSSILAGLAVFALVFTPLAASAQRIYVNGVDITGANLKNWTLSRVENVVFDAEGNIRIDAPGYNVQVVAPEPANPTPPPPPAAAPTTARTQAPAATPNAAPNAAASAAQTAGASSDAPRDRPVPRMSDSYVMTFANAERGAVPYAIDIVINGRHVANWGSSRGNSALDVTSFIVPGRNVVTFLGRRKAGAPVGTAAQQMQILVGVGTYDGRSASVRDILAGQVFHGSDTDPERRISVDFQVER